MFTRTACAPQKGGSVVTLADYFVQIQSTGERVRMSKDSIREIMLASKMERTSKIVFNDGSAILCHSTLWDADNSGYERYIHGKGNVVVGS